MPVDEPDSLGDSAPRADYTGVHRPRYERIAAGAEPGWSSPAEVAGMLAQLDWALALPSAPARGRLLELGCGDGCLTEQLAARRQWRVAGIDVIPLAIELAHKRLADEGLGAELVHGEVGALPWPDESFDLAVDSHCLHCIVNADRAACLREVRRVLNPGGLFVVITMCGDPAYLQGGEFDRETRNLVRGGIAGRHFGTAESILAEVSAAGFTVAQHRIWPARHDQENDDLVVAALAL